MPCEGRSKTRTMVILRNFSAKRDWGVCQEQMVRNIIRTVQGCITLVWGRAPQAFILEMFRKAHRGDLMRPDMKDVMNESPLQGFGRVVLVNQTQGEEPWAGMNRSFQS